jgi:hypothetical protein
MQQWHISVSHLPSITFQCSNLLYKYLFPGNNYRLARFNKIDHATVPVRGARLVGSRRRCTWAATTGTWLARTGAGMRTATRSGPRATWPWVRTWLAPRPAKYDITWQVRYCYVSTKKSSSVPLVTKTWQNYTNCLISHKHKCNKIRHSHHTTTSSNIWIIGARSFLTKQMLQNRRAW